MLNRNQIEVVICQIRFNVQFGIEEKMGLIQEDLKSKYPVSSISIEGEPLIPFSSINPINNYCLETEDHKWKINVTRGFLSLSAYAYKDWNDFKKRLQDVLSVARRHLPLDNTTRIGLRYINAIRRSKLVKGYLPEWNELVESRALGLMGTYADSTTAYSSRIEYEYKGSRCCTMTGQITFDDDGEIGFLIDNDVFTDRPEKIDDVIEILDGFNGNCYELFRSMVTDQLMGLMR